MTYRSNCNCAIACSGLHKLPWKLTIRIKFKESAVMVEHRRKEFEATKVPKKNVINGSKTHSCRPPKTLPEIGKLDLYIGWINADGATANSLDSACSLSIKGDTERVSK